MSAIDNSGLVGVSTQITVVLGRTASRTASASESGTGVYSTPQPVST